MSKSNKLNTVFRRISRAFAAKDERAFEDALDELEEHVEEAKDEEEPDTVEVHNHIPDSMMMDTSRGELPEKDPPGFDRRGRDSEEEAPPWFKKHEEATDKRFKSMADSIAELKGGDRRRNDDNFGGEEPDENLEMEDRRRNDDRRDRRDRRNNDEPSEREEMAERMRENGADRRHDDRRDRRNDDEANKEILGELEFEAPPGTGDKAKKARDSQYLADAFQETASKAEVLAPGIALPTFDAKAAPVKTFRAIDKLRRTALDLAYNVPATRGVIEQAMSGRTMDSKVMSFAATRVLFNATAAQVGSDNNRRATDTRDNNRNNNGGPPAGRVQSIADWNKVNREKYAQH